MEGMTLIRSDPDTTVACHSLPPIHPSKHPAIIQPTHGPIHPSTHPTFQPSSHES
ncbi:hypothetical protein BO94DRAFT_537449 [Aspergillus sclerotioniger CBS 115572]|uniref:Uncharacterized protein n=1 Tax=Aspergillus sclerotioniger CBS 115572 TaxID=1450535 RepID=A0A317W099_9EURO|nr:hypothetical protein BO94DRAFT_537449 [Aspergillus sclerotioniger CBS 115572]PWY79425.1 hypothetical protein BO94DRAFT_537449 [Aspergillus sclerotioniger CBS 115572]